MPLQGMAPTECSKCLPACLLACFLACLIALLIALFELEPFLAKSHARTDNIPSSWAPVGAKKCGIG